MASVSKQDIPQISAFMSDLWELEKKYWIPEDTAEYWNSLIDDCSELTGKYQNEQFIVDMLAVFVDSRQEQNKKWRMTHGKGRTKTGGTTEKEAVRSYHYS